MNSAVGFFVSGRSVAKSCNCLVKSLFTRCTVSLKLSPEKPASLRPPLSQPRIVQSCNPAFRTMAFVLLRENILHSFTLSVSISITAHVLPLLIHLFRCLQRSKYFRQQNFVSSRDYLRFDNIR